MPRMLDVMRRESVSEVRNLPTHSWTGCISDAVHVLLIVEIACPDLIGHQGSHARLLRFRCRGPTSRGRGVQTAAVSALESAVTASIREESRKVEPDLRIS
jgi:hypothetical protein